MNKITSNLALIAILLGATLCNVNVYIIHDKKYETDIMNRNKKTRCDRAKKIGKENKIVSYHLDIESISALSMAMRESSDLFTKFDKKLSSKKMTQTPLSLANESDFNDLSKCFIKYRNDYETPTVLPFGSYKEIDTAFSAIAKSCKLGTLVTIKFVPRVQAPVPEVNYSRILAETEATVEASNGNTHIYISSPGILGILFSIFCIVVFYIGTKCALAVDAPANFASNEFRYGREM